MPGLLSSTKRVARKAHYCDACSPFKIEPGTTYLDQRYAYDGRAYTLKFCLDCEAIAHDVWLWAYDPHEGITAEDYFGWATEHESEDERAKAYLVRMRHVDTVQAVSP